MFSMTESTMDLKTEAHENLVYDLFFILLNFNSV